MDGGMKYGNNKAGAKYGTGYCDAQCPRNLKFVEGMGNVQDWNSEEEKGMNGNCCA